MIIETRAVPPFFKNGFVIACESTAAAAVVDPGDEVEELLDVLRQRDLTAKYILLTHAHLDHITGVSAAKEALQVPIWLHEADNFLYEGVVQQGMMFGLRVQKQAQVDHFYAANQKLALGQYEMSAHHTPGHCPGGVCLAVNGRSDVKGPTAVPSLFVGDTLFAGSIGRTDLPGGDMDTLLRSIREVLFAFPDEAPVYSGHGEVTTIGREKRTNPFLRT
jgi:glyoxylase-like metal-dependent hydrolase (beta-lactamase superfamily II)